MKNNSMVVRYVYTISQFSFSWENCGIVLGEERRVFPYLIGDRWNLMEIVWRSVDVLDVHFNLTAHRVSRKISVLYVYKYSDAEGMSS